MSAPFTTVVGFLKDSAAVNEDKDAAQSDNRHSWWGKEQAEVIRRRKAAPERPTAKSAHDEAASAARGAAEAADRSGGRTL